MLCVMHINKTALERAFELARSGACANVALIVRRLNSEGYLGAQVDGRQLKKQLARIIEEATNAKAKRTKG
jgi:hypothetical protein